jgi:hypothetical protein
MASALASERSLLARACEQASDVDDGLRGTVRVGLVFAAPSIWGEDDDGLVERMRAAAAAARPDLLAWSFPTAARTLVSDLQRTKGRRYPGVFLVWRMAPGARRHVCMGEKAVSE